MHTLFWKVFVFWEQGNTFIKNSRLLFFPVFKRVLDLFSNFLLVRYVIRCFFWFLSRCVSWIEEKVKAICLLGARSFENDQVVLRLEFSLVQFFIYWFEGYVFDYTWSFGIRIRDLGASWNWYSEYWSWYLAYFLGENWLSHFRAHFTI